MAKRMPSKAIHRNSKSYERRKVTETQQERFHRLLAEVNIIHKAEMTHVSELREMAGLGVVGLREDKGTRCQHER